MKSDSLISYKLTIQGIFVNFDGSQYRSSANLF